MIATNDFKIIFTGPVGAGKTTAINAISDIPPVRTDESASDQTRQIKPKTTVAMDYGIMYLNDTERVHLYGTPGQERFDFMWDILTKNGIGLVLLISNTRPNPFKDLRFFLEAFKQFINDTKVVVGVTQMDLKTDPLIADYNKFLRANRPRIPVFEVDARSPRDVALMIESLLYSLDLQVEL